MMIQRILKPKFSATKDPINGPAACADAHATVNNAAYWPRLCDWVLAIQYEFINGIESISPIVITSIEKTASKV